MLGFFQTDNVDEDFQADVFYAAIQEGDEVGVPADDLYMEEGKPQMYRKFTIRTYPAAWSPKYRFALEIHAR